jgi:antitoxin ParD1/3/4
MNVSLTPELEEFVEHKVASGLYGSSSEVVRDALRLMEERDRLLDARLEDLRGEVQKGLTQLKEGRSKPLDRSAVERIRSAGSRRLASRRRKKRA